MPILFNRPHRLQQQQSHPSARSPRYTPDRPTVGRPRRILNAAPTAIRRLSLRLSDTKQFRSGRKFRAGIRRSSIRNIRAGIRRHSIRAGKHARQSIRRLRRHGSSLRKYLRNPRHLFKLAKYIYQRRHIKHLLPLIFFVLYTLLGAALFQSLEAEAEKQRILERNTEYERERLLFVKRMEEILLDLGAKNDPAKKRAYLEEAVDHMSWKLSYELAAREPEWTFSTSMYFAGTIFSTIGYGDVACLTNVGRLATVLYAIFGIPLMLITWNEMGKFLYKSINEFMAALTKKCKHNTLWSTIKSKVRDKCRRVCTICYCCCRCWPAILKWRRKKRQQAADEKNNSSLPEDDDVLMENGGLMMMRQQQRNGKLPNQKEKEEARIVSFKLSMQTHSVQIPIDVIEEASDEEDDGDGTNYDNDDEYGDNSDDSDVPIGQHKKHVTNNSTDDAESRSDQEEDVDEEEDEEEEEEEEDEKKEAPRMHVLIAIGCTFSWVFLCALLFTFWEDWSYWESLYFTFISLLTIGLGDINVRRRDLMVLCFFFVIIGLSLVSMCIMVIQSALEDFYKRLLMKMMTDYQESLAKNGSKKRATMGALKALSGNKTAKYILPMLSQNTKRCVLQKVEEEAHDVGMDVPPLFKHFETFAVVTEHGTEMPPHDEEAIVEEILQKDQEEQAQHPSQYGGRSVSFCCSYFNMHDIEIQTDEIGNIHKNSQTNQTTWKSVGIQTEKREAIERDEEKKAPIDVQLQTDGLNSVRMQGAQTEIVNHWTVGTQTVLGTAQEHMNADTQTERVLSQDQATHTHPPPFDLMHTFDKSVQVYKKFMKSRRIQTPVPLMTDVHTQTIDTDLRGKLHPSVSLLKLFLQPLDPLEPAQN